MHHVSAQQGAGRKASITVEVAQMCIIPDVILGIARHRSTLRSALVTARSPAKSSTASRSARPAYMLSVVDSRTMANTNTFGRPSVSIDATHSGMDTLYILL